MNGSATPKIGHFLIVTGFTGLNLLLGLIALFFIMMDVTTVAAWCLLTCVVIDAFDGMLARHWCVTSDFGAQLDSLADMTSFMVASAVLMFYWLEPDLPFALMVAASCLYVLSGAVRLARFNTSLPSSRYFQGMPTTVVAAVVAMAYLTYPQLDSLWGVALVALLTVLMVSVFPYPKLCEVRKLPAALWLVVFLGLVLSPAWALWLLALAYIVAGPSLWAYRRWRGSGR